MRVKMWRLRGADEQHGPEAGQGAEGLWRDLDEHARALEAMARAIRLDVSRRNASTASTSLGNLMRQSQQAYDEVGRLLGAAAAHASPSKRVTDV
jgi:hypothetical protein